MYNKLFTKILDSSIWLTPTPTRIVWLTFIAVMDEDGFCQFASVANVAHRARVTQDEAQEAIAYLESPDLDSSDPEYDGRRVERVPGGWVVLNADKHRKLVTKAIIQEQTRERVRRLREKRKSNAPVTPRQKRNALVTPSEAIAEVHTHVPRAREAATGGGVGAGTFPRDHLRHAYCSGRGKCVPDWLHAEFLAALGGGDEAEADLRAWYGRVEAGWPPGPIGDEPVRLWRAVFAAEWPSVAPRPGARGAARPAAGDPAPAPPALLDRQATQQARVDAAEALADRYLASLDPAAVAALDDEATAALEAEAPMARRRMATAVWRETLARRRRALVLERMTPAALAAALGESQVVRA